MQGTQLCAGPQKDNSWLSSPNFIVGVGLFLAGMFGNIQSDAILRNLRKPGESGYKIPRGGVFEYVSAANYFCETIEWTGFALACSNFSAGEELNFISGFFVYQRSFNIIYFSIL